MVAVKNSLSLKRPKTLFGKVNKSTNQTTTKMVKKEVSLRCLDGHMLMLLKSAISLLKLDGWESKFSHLKNLFSQTNGLKMESLIHGTSCINQLPTNSMVEMETDKSSEIWSKLAELQVLEFMLMPSPITWLVEETMFGRNIETEIMVIAPRGELKIPPVLIHTTLKILTSNYPIILDYSQDRNTQVLPILPPISIAKDPWTLGLIHSS